jgi:hypothetical protein
MMKPGPQKYAQATFPRDRALETVHRHGAVLRLGNAGIGKECARTGFSVFYSDPETASPTSIPTLIYVPTAQRSSLSDGWPAARWK